MKLFTNNKLNTLFTVKKDSDTSDFVAVENNDIFNVLLKKKHAWALQALLDEELCLMLTDAECDDSRISKVIDIRYDDSPASCQGVLSISEDVNIAEKVLMCNYDDAINILHISSSVSIEIDQERENETTYVFRDGSGVVDKCGVLRIYDNNE